MEVLVWIAAAHAVCAGVFLILARRAPVIEDEADLPFLEEHQVDRPSGELHDPAAGRQKAYGNGHLRLAGPKAGLPQRLELPPG
jgi:hypothetical protein